MNTKYEYLIDHLRSSLTETDICNLQAYHEYHQEIQIELNEWLLKELGDHKAFSDILSNMSDEELQKQNEVSSQYQREAFFKNNWEPLILHQVNMGIGYAKMGIAFYMWHDVVALAHKFILSKILIDDKRSLNDKMAILNGTNRYFDISMSIIGESYLNENKELIQEQKKQQEKINKELNRTLSVVKEKNKELEQFAYVASHDLQEPLRMVTSFLTQLSKKYSDQLDDKARQYIHFAVDGASRMRTIILDLLEFSRVGKTNHEFELVDMNELLNEVIQLNNNLIDEKEVLIEFDELPKIYAARIAMQQVLQNLIGNAIKYHLPDEKTVIRINALETEDSWQFSVSDNGIGIDPQYFDKIFVLFQRLHNKTEYTGTGIGLALCKKIVEFHDGQIWVESEQNKGSTFHFTISKHIE